MSDLISRADAIDAVMKHKMPFSIQQEVAREIDALPSAKYVTEKPNDAVKASKDVINRADAKEAVYLLGKRPQISDVWDCLDTLPSADAIPKMTEEVREALMRLTMCAREECDMCKYKDECGFDFQYKISTENMNTILDAFISADAVQGEWVDMEIPCNPYPPVFCVECSRCGYRVGRETFLENTFNFCPNCGARMKGGDSE